MNSSLLMELDVWSTILIIVSKPIDMQSREDKKDEQSLSKYDGICPECGTRITMTQMLFSYDKKIKCKKCKTSYITILPRIIRFYEKLILISNFLIMMVIALFGFRKIDAVLVFIIVLLFAVLAYINIYYIYYRQAYLKKIH